MHWDILRELQFKEEKDKFSTMLNFVRCAVIIIALGGTGSKKLDNRNRRKGGRVTEKRATLFI